MTNPITPQIGRASLLAFLGSRSPLGPLEVMARQMGRFFQIPIPGFQPFVVFGPDANRRVLVTERKKLLWRSTDPVTDLLRRGVLVVDGEEHDLYRALMETPLHPSRLPGYTPMMIEQTDQVTAAWKDGQTIDLLVEGRKIALLIIMQALFSRDAWNDLPGIWNPIVKTIEYISPGPWILWRKIPRPGFRMPLAELDQYLYAIIQERRKHQVTGRDLMQHLIEAGLSDEIIRDQMLTMLIAGHDTSTALFAWTFALLGQHAGICARVLQEVDALERSPLLDLTIKEALRLYPPIHIGNRAVADELEFAEGKIPAGQRMFYSIYLTHRDPDLWENADQFCPERFTNGRQTPPFAYVPFGGGPRSCIGAAFGQAEARTVIARLLRGFSFELLNAEKIHAHMGATLAPRPGVLARVRKRN